METHKDNLLKVGGLFITAAAVVAVNPAGVGISSAATNIINCLAPEFAGHFLTSINYSKFKELLVKQHPDQLNHDLDRLVKDAVLRAVRLTKKLYLEKVENKGELLLSWKYFKPHVENEVNKTLNKLENLLKEELSKHDAAKIGEVPLGLKLSVKDLLLDKPEKAIDDISDYIFDKTTFGNDKKALEIKAFFTQNLPSLFDLCYKEALKDDKNTKAFKAFQIWLLEDIYQQNKLQLTGQQTILAEIKALKEGVQTHASLLLDNTLNEQIGKIQTDLINGFNAILNELSEVKQKLDNLIENNSVLEYLIATLKEKDVEIAHLKQQQSNPQLEARIIQLTQESEELRQKLFQSEELIALQEAQRQELEQRLNTDNDELNKQASQAVEKKDYDKAEELLLDGLKKVKEEEANKYYNLGLVKELKLQFAEALTYFELAANVPPATNLVFLNKAGELQKMFGGLNKAIKYFSDALNIAVKELGEESRGAATYYNNLGLVWLDKGNLDKAIDYLSKALAINTKLFGEENPNVATGYNNLGGAWQAKGDLNKAINYYSKSIEISKKFLGEENTNFAILYNNLSLALKGKGDLDKAIDCLEKALAIDIKLSGEENLNVSSIYNNLGSVWQDKGDLDKSIYYFTKAISINIKLFGEENPNVAASYSNLGLVWRTKGDLDKAIEYLTHALSINLKLFGEESLNEAIQYNILGMVWKSKGDLDKAIDYNTRALAINIKLFGEESPNVATGYNNLGIVWQAKGNLNQAIDYYTRSLDIDIKLFGEENQNVATHYNNLGSVWKSKGDLDQAIDYYTKALAIDIKLFGEENQNVAIRYNNLGLAWQDKGDLDKAIDYYTKALAINIKLFGTENPNIAINYNNIGGIWNAKGDLAKANDYYTKALEIDIKLFGEENPSVAICYNNLGSVWQAKGVLEKALDYFQKAHSIFLKLYGADNPSTLSIKKNLDISLAAMKKP